MISISLKKKNYCIIQNCMYLAFYTWTNKIEIDIFGLLTFCLSKTMANQITAPIKHHKNILIEAK